MEFPLYEPKYGIPSGAPVRVAPPVQRYHFDLPSTLPVAPLDAGPGLGALKAVGQATELVGGIADKFILIAGQTAARKQQLDDTMWASKAYRDHVAEVENAITDHAQGPLELYVPGVQSSIFALTQKYEDQAPTPEARTMFLKQSSAFAVSRMDEARKYQLGKYQKQAEGGLENAITQYTKEARSATSQAAFEVAVQGGYQSIGNFLSKLDPASTAKKQREWVDQVWGQRANEDSIRNPEKFIRERDLYRNNVDAKYLNELVKEAETRKNTRSGEEWTNVTRREHTQDRMHKMIAERTVSGFLSSFMSEDPTKFPGVAVIQDFLGSPAGDHVGADMKKFLLTRAHAPSVEGGTDFPGTVNQLRYRIAVDPDMVTEGEIMRAVSAGTVSVKTAVPLLEHWQQRKLAGDISHASQYVLGKELIRDALAPFVGMEGPAAKIVSLVQPAELERARARYVAAVYEFDAKARKEYKGKENDLQALALTVIRGHEPPKGTVVFTPPPGPPPPRPAQAGPVQSFWDRLWAPPLPAIPEPPKGTGQNPFRPR